MIIQWLRRLGSAALAPALLIGALAVPAAAAEPVKASADLHISQANPTQTLNSYAWLSICPATCGTTANAERRALTSFAVSGVPAGATDVTLSLQVTAARTTDTALAAHQVTQSWSKDSVTWNTKPAFGPSLDTHTGPVSGQVVKFDVSSVFDGNGTYSFGLTASAGAQAVLHSSRATGDLGPRLLVTYSDPPPVAKGPLPFDLPSTSTLRASKKKVFAHYFTPYPLSLDNKEPALDYYTRNYLNPAGESGKHAAYGGLLRDRPIGRGPLSGDWQLADMEKEVRTAAAAGLDGFTLDILSLTSQHWTRDKLLIKAAANADPGFKIVLMPDMTALTADATTLAASMAELAKSPAVHRLDDGRVVISPFKAENKTPAWWTEFIKIMKDTHGVSVAFVPVFLNFTTNYKNYAAISYGFSNWGNRSPAQQGGIATNIATAHAAGKIWMQPVAPQDERPNQGIYDEARNSENLRTTWENAIAGGTDWVQLTTWNDFSEGTQIAPSPHNDSAWLDLSSYYLTKLKTGKAPAIVRDTLYLSHRVQFAAARPDSGTQTTFMTLRSGSSPARDSVEVLSFLTGAATITSGGQSVSAEAGVTARLFPLAYGSIKASAARQGQAVASVATPFAVNKSFAVQDLQYVAATSGRP